MVKKEVETLKDLQAFIEFAIKNHRKKRVTFSWTLVDLAHDIGGTVREDKCFVPRTRGYAERMAKA